MQVCAFWGGVSLYRKNKLNSTVPNVCFPKAYKYFVGVCVCAVTIQFVSVRSLTTLISEHRSYIYELKK